MQILTRRGFLEVALSTGAAALVPSCWRQKQPIRSYTIPGEMVGGSHEIGHLVRKSYKKNQFSNPESTIYDVAIIGGGASGLCASWKLKKAGFENFVLLELEDSLGGTSVSGKANGTEFPWAAHYLNIPPPEADCVNEVLEDLKVIQGYDEKGFPIIPKEYILKWPRERLFQNGKWGAWNLYEGAPAREQEILREFEDDMLYWTLFKGRDGRRAFALPLKYSTSDPFVRKLDNISMADYIHSKGWRSSRLDWKINYACRDDYGGTMDTVSAWAGIHYFACRNYDRRLHKEYPSDTLTWPAGNGFLIQKLSEKLKPDQRRTNCVVLRVENEQNRVFVGYYDTRRKTFQSLLAKTVIYAAKLHAAPYLIRGMPEEQKAEIRSMIYSPWLTASIHVRRLPESGFGSTAWDNVLYESKSIGYIVADHQIRGQRGPNAPSVLVYYLPFVEDIKTARKNLMEKDHAHWVNIIMQDLIQADPQLEKDVQRIDIYRWGHAMVQPAPGSIWGKKSQLRRNPVGSVFFGPCEASGLPLFEEACFSGIRAAELAMKKFGGMFSSSLKGLANDATTSQ